jgi:hypothetical protein
MSVNLTNYSKTKNKVLIGYFGASEEFLCQMLDMRPLIESTLDGLIIYIGCLDQYAHHLEGHPRILKMSELKDRKLDFGKIHEVLCDGVNHSIAQLMSESNIPIKASQAAQQSSSKRCLIAPNGNYPTKNMTEAQVSKATALARQEGYSVEFGDDISDIGWVIGVENVATWKAGRDGKRVSLVSNGVGTNFYITTWKQIKVLEI